MEKAKNFTDLLVWQKAHQLVLEIYKSTRQFPKDELFGLTNQLRRAAVSIPANIAEGFIKSGYKDKIRFYNISEGSLNEVKYYLILAKDLNYTDTSILLGITDEIGKMLKSYIRSINKNSNPKLLSPNF